MLSARRWRTDPNINTDAGTGMDTLLLYCKLAELCKFTCGKVKKHYWSLKHVDDLPHKS